MKLEFIKFKQRKVNGLRTPHKPLLFLLACQAYVNNHQRLLSFEHYLYPRHFALLEMLDNDNPKPEYPFWRMQTDKIWDVEADTYLKPNTAGDVACKHLFASNAKGGLTADLYHELTGSPQSYNHIASNVIEKHFDLSSSLKQQLLDYFLTK